MFDSPSRPAGEYVVPSVVSSVDRSGAPRPGCAPSLLLKLSQAIDALNRWVGETTRWLILAIPVICVSCAVIRKVFRWGHNGFTELQWYLFGIVFLLSAGYTLLREEHVRIDVLWQRFSIAARCWIDIVVHATLLIPACAYMSWKYWFFWLYSVRNADGPEDVVIGLERWPLKLALFLGFTLLGLQCMSELIKRVAILRGWRKSDILAEGGLFLEKHA